MATSGKQSGAGMYVLANIPVTDHTFVEGIMPLSLYVPFGNMTLGAHHIVRIGKSFWITAGGAAGIPLLEDGNATLAAVPRAYWDLHHYFPKIFPIQAKLGLEFITGIFALRAQLEPSLWIGVGSREDVSGTFQHAVEVQLGHGLGGGLRLQGIVIGPGSDNYQFALSPFLVASRDIGFLRVGLMLPMNKPLGPAFKENRAWGMMFATGMHLD